MKKLALILLIAVYTVSVIGISINRFYCCGNLESTSISPLAFNKSTAKEDGCCEHKQTFFTVKDSHEVSGIAHVAKAAFVFITTRFNAHANITAYKFTATTRSNTINAPPLLLHFPIYTQLCNYRI